MSRFLFSRGMSADAPSQVISALYWEGNTEWPDPSPSSILYWPTPMANRPATYIMDVFPRVQPTGAGWYSGLFWANLEFDVFTQWDNLTTAAYGMHIYPTGASQTAPFRWEISSKGSDNTDNPNGADVAFGTFPPAAPSGSGWFTHVMRVSSGAVERFHPDWPNATPFLQTNDNALPAPASPAIIIGDAPWRQGREKYCGLMRGLRFYDAELNDAEVTASRANPFAIRTPWYLNLNPRPDDVLDRSGNNNHPTWTNANRPLLWSPS